MGKKSKRVNDSSKYGLCNQCKRYSEARNGDLFYCLNTDCGFKATAFTNRRPQS